MYPCACLWNDCQLLPQRIQPYGRGVNAVKVYGATCQFYEPEQRQHQAAFATARAPHDAARCAGLELKAELAQHRREAWPVAGSDSVKAQRTPGRPAVRRRWRAISDPVCMRHKRKTGRQHDTQAEDEEVERDTSRRQGGSDGEVVSEEARRPRLQLAIIQKKRLSGRSRGVAITHLSGSAGRREYSSILSTQVMLFSTSTV